MRRATCTAISANRRTARLCRRLVPAALLLGAVMAWAGPASADGAVGSPSVGQTRVEIRQHGLPVPLVPDRAGVLHAALDRTAFAMLFPRMVFAMADYQTREPNVRIFISADARLFDYVRTPAFVDRVGPAHAYAMPAPGEHYLMLTEVDFDRLMTAHNYMVDYRLDIDGADVLGLTVERIVERDMTDRLPAGPSPLYAVVVIHLAPPTGDMTDPGAGPQALTPALIDYLELTFPDRTAWLPPSP